MARKPAADLPLLLGNQLCFAVYSTAHAFNRATSRCSSVSG